MSDCRQLEPLVTPYVDGELSAEARAALDEHLRACAPCCSRVRAEQTVRELLGSRRALLRKDCASDALRARCAPAPRGAALAGFPSASPRPTWRGRLAPTAIAASLVLVVSGVSIYQLTVHSPRVMAAELTADHVKCFGVNRLLGTHDDAATVERSLASRFGWEAHLPVEAERLGLELVGARPCLYGEGRVAHIMYRHNGHPVSVFMLPGTSRRHDVVDVMGHQATIWSAGGRTFVLIAQEPRADVQQMASFVQTSLR